MVDNHHPKLSQSKQCELLSIHRSGLYYKPCGENEINLKVMDVIDKEYQKMPFYGVARMSEHLKKLGYPVNQKRVRRLYRLMDLRAIFPGSNTSKANQLHKKYPYLLRDLTITHNNQVWACDITYIPMKHGFMYLVAIIDLHSRFVVGWGISNSLEADFCIEVLKQAIHKYGKPEIFNTDQGVQFTSEGFTQVLKDQEIQISMDGKGRAIDNIFIERLWRSVKYENVYLHAYADGLDLYKGLKDYFEFYNYERIHQSLKYQTPAFAYTLAA